MVMNAFWGERDRKRSLTPGNKKVLMLRAKGCCEYCGKDIYKMGMSENIHHIIEFSKGGSDRASNLIVLCPDCHSKVHTTGISTETLRKKIAYRLPKSSKTVKTKASVRSKSPAAAKKKTKTTSAKTKIKDSKAAPKKTLSPKRKKRKTMSLWDPIWG
jgi:hypothetical protein